MRGTFTAAAAALFASVALVSAQGSSAPSCGNGAKCPKSSPCCSQYGQCGVGAYCLGGCDPKNSFDLKSCTPAPVCKSADYKMSSTDDIMSNTRYLGDSSNVNWVASGQPVAYNNDAVLLTMAPDTVGTLLTSTHYVWYGKVSATMSTSQGQGVVTAFILMSDMKDEIDFEFVGVDLEHAQSNFYFQGITNYNNGMNLSTTDTRANTHTYEIDWQPDQTTWSIDGQVMRTLKRSDTWNATDNQFHYPQSPARVQLSLWPAGLPSNGQGTIDWSGGVVSWNSPYMSNGYYYAMVKDVTVQCYDPPSSFKNNFGSKSYYYTNALGVENTVAIGNNDTTLASLYATGDDPNNNPYASASASGATMSATPETVPGVSGGGVRGEDGETPSSGVAGDTGNAGQQPVGSGSTTFVQGGTGTGSSGAGRVVAGSAVALLGFFVAALML